MPEPQQGQQTFEEACTWCGMVTVSFVGPPMLFVLGITDTTGLGIFDMKARLCIECLTELLLLVSKRRRSGSGD